MAAITLFCQPRQEKRRTGVELSKQREVVGRSLRKLTWRLYDSVTFASWTEVMLIPTTTPFGGATASAQGALHGAVRKDLRERKTNDI